MNGSKREPPLFPSTLLIHLFGMITYDDSADDDMLRVPQYLQAKLLMDSVELCGASSKLGLKIRTTRITCLLPPAMIC